MNNKQIKSIWIFNHHAISPEQAGGTRHYDLARELTKRGYEVVIFASSFSHREQRELKLTDEQSWSTETVDGVRFVWIKTTTYANNSVRRLLNMMSFGVRSRRLGKKLPSLDRSFLRPDLVIGSSVHLFAVAAAAKVAKHFKARFFMEVRDIWPQTLVDMGIFGKHHPLVLYLRWLERRLYRQAEEIIVTFPYAAKYFAKHGIKEDRLLHLPQVVSEDIYGKALEPTAAQDPFVVGYFGSHGPADCVDVLVKSAQWLDPERFKLIFVGDGKEKDALVRLASDKKFTNVVFLDSVPKHELPKMLRKVSICSASLGDGKVWQEYGISKNKFIDYLAAGKPIVFSGQVPNDVVSEARCGITVKPGDPELIADAIKELSLLSTDDLWAMGERGRKYVMENHSSALLVDRLEHLWQAAPSQRLSSP